MFLLLRLCCLLELFFDQGLNSGWYIKHLLVDPLLKGLLRFRGLTCCHCYGIAILAIIATLVGVVSQMRAALILAMLAKICRLCFLGTCSPGFPGAECFLGLPLALLDADDTSFAFVLRFAWFFSFMMCSIASRSGRRTRGDLGRMKCDIIH
jgi:hypothetical protein